MRRCISEPAARVQHIFLLLNRWEGTSLCAVSNEKMEHGVTELRI